MALSGEHPRLTVSTRQWQARQIAVSITKPAPTSGRDQEGPDSAQWRLGMTVSNDQAVKP